MYIYTDHDILWWMLMILKKCCREFSRESGLSYIAQSRRIHMGGDNWKISVFISRREESIEHCCQREQYEQNLIAWKESWDWWDTIWEKPGNGRNGAMMRKTLILN